MYVYYSSYARNFSSFIMYFNFHMESRFSTKNCSRQTRHVIHFWESNLWCYVYRKNISSSETERLFFRLFNKNLYYWSLDILFRKFYGTLNGNVITYKLEFALITSLMSKSRWSTYHRQQLCSRRWAILIYIVILFSPIRSLIILYICKFRVVLKWHSCFSRVI